MFKDKEIEWEYCASFLNMRCMAKRPLGVRVSYITDEGDEMEEVLTSHETRVFLHELDHINGRTMTHWRASEGNIDFIDGEKDNYKHT